MNKAAVDKRVVSSSLNVVALSQVVSGTQHPLTAYFKSLLLNSVRLNRKQ